MRSPSSPPDTPAGKDKPQEGHTQPTAQSGTDTPAQPGTPAHAQPSATAPAMGEKGTGQAGRERAQDFDTGPHRDPWAAQAFAQAARTLYGEAWIRPAAHALGVNVRTIERLAKAVHTDQSFPVHATWLQYLDAELAHMQMAVMLARDTIRSQAYGRTPVATTPPPQAPSPAGDTTPTPDPMDERGGAPWTRPDRQSN